MTKLQINNISQLLKVLAALTLLLLSIFIIQCSSEPKGSSNDKDKNDQNMEKFVDEIRKQSYVSGPGAIVGASVTIVDRTNIELSYALHKDLSKLDKSIQELNDSSSRLSIFMIILSIAMVFLGVVQIILMVKQSSKLKSEDNNKAANNINDDNSSENIEA